VRCTANPCKRNDPLPVGGIDARLAEPTFIIKHVTAVMGVRNCNVTTMSIRQHRNMLVG